MPALALALALTAAIPAAQAESRSPDTALLDAFKAACGRIQDFDSATADAAGSGWEPIADDADPRVAKLLTIGREAMEDEGKIRGATFRRAFDRRAVFLIVSRYEDGSGYWGNGCRVYDFDAPAAIPAATLEAWMGRPPTGVQELTGAVKRLWEPGWRDGIAIELNFVPAGHPVAGTTGIQGNVLVAQAIGGL